MARRPEVQGCALRKIEGSPAYDLYEKIRFSNRWRANVRRQGPLGSARAVLTCRENNGAYTGYRLPKNIT